MLFERMHHVAILVSDYRRSREFYVEKLGFPVLREHFRADRGDWKLDLKFGEGELELSIVPAIEDVEDVEPEVRTLVLLRTQIDGYTYEVPSLQDGFEIVSDELGITATYEDGKVTFHTQNGGTGSFSILFRGDGSALLLVVYVLEPVNSL